MKRRQEIKDIEPEFVFYDGIIAIPMTPMMPPDLLDSVVKSGKCKAVVLQSFGGGNIPNTKTFSYLPFVKRTIKLGIPVIVTCLFPTNPNDYLVYESGIDAANVGAIQIRGLVLPALLAKLSWVLPQTQQISDQTKRMNKIKQLLMTPYVGEIEPTPGFEGIQHK